MSVASHPKVPRLADPSDAASHAAEGRRPVTCNTCTIQLVRLAEQRAWWFGPARAPLVLGMRALARLHGVDPDVYALRSADCRGCLRFAKLELKQRSPLFRALNGLINPWFDRVLAHLLSPEEMAEAKRAAKDLYGKP